MPGRKISKKNNKTEKRRRQAKKQAKRKKMRGVGRFQPTVIAKVRRLSSKQQMFHVKQL